MKVKAVGSASKGRFSPWLCHTGPKAPKDFTSFSLFPQAYNGEEITVFTKVVLEAEGFLKIIQRSSKHIQVFDNY